MSHRNKKEKEIYTYIVLSTKLFLAVIVRLGSLFRYQPKYIHPPAVWPGIKAAV